MADRHEQMVALTSVWTRGHLSLTLDQLESGLLKLRVCSDDDRLQTD